MPVRIHFPKTTYSQNKAAIKAAFPKSSKWDMKTRKGWFGKDLDITAHLRSGEPGTLYLEGKQDFIDSVVNACKEIVDSCQVEVVDEIPDFKPFVPGGGKRERTGGIDLSPQAMLEARLKNERSLMQSCGMPEEFIEKWLAIIRKEHEEKTGSKG